MRLGVTLWIRRDIECRKCQSLTINFSVVSRGTGDRLGPSEGVDYGKPNGRTPTRRSERAATASALYVARRWKELSDELYARQPAQGPRGGRVKGGASSLNVLHLSVDITRARIRRRRTTQKRSNRPGQSSRKRLVTVAFRDIAWRHRPMRLRARRSRCAARSTPAATTRQKSRWRMVPALTLSLTPSRARGADDGGRRRRDASYGVARDSNPVSTIR
jgi:hypothetical protein